MTSFGRLLLRGLRSEASPLRAALSAARCIAVPLQPCPPPVSSAAKPAPSGRRTGRVSGTSRLDQRRTVGLVDASAEPSRADDASESGRMRGTVTASGLRAGVWRFAEMAGAIRRRDDPDGGARDSACRPGLLLAVQGIRCRLPEMSGGFPFRRPNSCQEEPRPGYDPYNEFLYQKIMRLQAAAGPGSSSSSAARRRADPVRDPLLLQRFWRRGDRRREDHLDGLLGQHPLRPPGRD